MGMLIYKPIAFKIHNNLTTIKTDVIILQIIWKVMFAASHKTRKAATADLYGCLCEQSTLTCGGNTQVLPSGDCQCNSHALQLSGGVLECQR